MKIATVDAIPVRYPEPNDAGATRHLLLVRMRADDGQVGWGEAVTMWPEATRAAAAVVDGLTPLLVGRDPVESDALWRAMREHTWWYGVGGIASFAIAALDIAVWDLRGKAVGRSVLDLLGGAAHPRLPAVCSCHAFLAEIDALAEQMAGWLAGGARGIKVGFGKRGEAHLGYDHDRDVAFVRALRRAIGPDRLIMVDVGHANRWDLATAAARVAALEEYGLHWIEEPLGGDDPEGYRDLRSRIRTPVAYGEREWHVRGYERLLATGTVDVVGVDPGRAEGITGFRRVCELVERHRRTANAHAWSSAIVTAASLAVSFSSPVFRLFETKPLPNPMQDELVSSPIASSGGWMSPPTGPGLGIEVLDDVVERYRA